MLCENKKAPAGAGTPTRAAGNGLPTMYPTKDFTIKPEKIPPISVLLHPGAANGIKLPELVKLTGQEERIVRRRIQAERKDGKLILSDCLHGYFLPASEQEARRFIRSMSGRAAEIAAVARSAEAALADMAGQEQIEGW